MQSSRNPSFLVLFTVVLVFGSCQSQPAEKTDQTMAPPKPSDGVAVCVASQTRARQCTEVFIRFLVEARVRLDRPPGIAKADADGRRALLESVKAEWANDSKDESIAIRCEALAKNAPPEMLTAVTRCLAEDSCDAYSQCYVAVLEPTL